MPDEPSERPLADAAYEEGALALFPLTMSPKEYAAREAVRWASFSFADYRFRDAALDAWIQRLGEIFRTPGLIEQLQERYLSPEEIAEQRRREAEDW
jgi:hypothetical protein